MNIPKIVLDTSPYFTNASDSFMQNLLEIVGNPMLIGVILLLFFVFFIVMLKISFDIALVLFIPIMLIASVWLVPLRLIFFIIVGLLIGLGMLRLIGKR